MEVDLTMSIEVGKVIHTYEQSINMLSAKNELFIQDILNTNQSPQKRLVNQNALFEGCPIIISNSIQSLLRGWCRMYGMFRQFKYGNETCIKRLKTKMNSLKNNTDLLTKEQQLISEMESDIKVWSEQNDPIIYYDLKRRNNLLEQLQIKIKLIKDASALTKQSAAPMYYRKIQQQFKTTLYQVYIDSNLIDKNARQCATSQWEKMKAKIYKEGKQLGNLNLIKYVVIERNHFYQKYLDVFSRKVKLTENIFMEFYQSLHALIKNIKEFWKSYLRSLNLLISQTSQFQKILQQSKNDMDKRQSNVIKHLQKTTQTVTLIFSIQSSLNLLACLNQIFQIVPPLNKFFNCLIVAREIIQSSIKSCDEYINKISSQISLRQKQFNFFYMEDKSFLDLHMKNQNIVDKRLSQGYLDFLNNCYNLASDNKIKFFEKSLQTYQIHEIGSLLAKQIISYDSQRLKNSNFSQSQFSESSGSDDQGKKEKKNQKLIKIQNFISKFQIFDSNSINWNDDNIYSCALGPRLLLQGKIVILSQGIYFESIFNKKNLFFGRTKLFVPKQQILDILTQNTFVIFPDAISVKTKAGVIYFHFLGSRKSVNNILNEVYFPQNNPNEEDCVSDISFNCYPENETEKFTPTEVNDLLKPFQTFFLEKAIKNIKLNKLFRRYFSDEKFQIKGQQYQHFKKYFLLQIDAIQPNSTPMVPQAPSYFCYKNQQNLVKSFPKISQRYHTYRKAIPKVPFISSGGEGNCEEKVIYNWISPKILVITSISKVNGFSLTQGMQVYLKTICKQQGSDVKINLSAEIKFSKQATTNSLVKGPALSNLKDSMFKMVDIMQKYEKGKKGRSKKNIESKECQQNQQLQQKLQKLQKQNQALKKQRKIGLFAFVIIYILTIIVWKLSFN